jgi:pimeloyl-ACP methyl ester carboxylesterase
MSRASLRAAFLLLLLLFGCATEALPETHPTAALVMPAPQPRSFSVEVVGKGPPMILIPGLGCSGRVWTSTVAHYKERHTLHVVTIAGFGGAAPVKSEHLLDDVRAELITYIRGHRLERPVLVGHSLGAFLAYGVAATAPDAVGAVVAVDGLPFLPDYGMPGATVESARPKAEAIRSQMADIGREQFAANARAYLLSQITDPRKAETVAEDSVKTDIGAFSQAMYELFTTDLRPSTAKITAPTLHFVAGAYPKDPEGKLKLVARTEAQLARIPRHEVVLAPAARHFVMLDSPELFFGKIDSFLATNGGTR